MVHHNSKGERYPSHTELYRDFHKIEILILISIYEEMGWDFMEVDKKTEEVTDITSFSSGFEIDNWDIVYSIKKTPEIKLFDDRGGYLPLLIEYKSSIEEWGKQFDSYIRQIKSRIKGDGVPILLSFDKRFNDFERAAEKSGFVIVVLPEKLMEVLKYTEEEAEEFTNEMFDKLTEAYLTYDDDEDNENERVMLEEITVPVNNNLNLEHQFFFKLVVTHMQNKFVKTKDESLLIVEFLFENVGKLNAPFHIENPVFIVDKKQFKGGMFLDKEFDDYRTFILEDLYPTAVQSLYLVFRNAPMKEGVLHLEINEETYIIEITTEEKKKKKG